MGAQKKRDALEDVAHYYRHNSEDNRIGVQQLEFLVTLGLFQKYLKAGSRVLEIGSGSGRYTAFFAEEGHRVTAIDLVPELTETNRKRLEQMKLTDKVTLLTGDARDLVPQTKGPFEATIAMGPFYHLSSLQDRISLMAAMTKATANNGLVITMHLSRVGLIAYMLARFPEWALQGDGQVEKILAAGYLPDHPRNGDFRGYFSTVEEIRDLHESQGLEILQIHCQDPCIGPIDEIFNNLPPAAKSRWLEVLTNVSHDQAAWGSGRSLMCVSRK